MDELNATAGSGYPAWVNYKLYSADWHCSNLDRVLRHVDADRWLGVEMCIDGAVGALSGAFDAAVSALIVTLEASPHGQGLTPVPEHLHTWKEFEKQASAAGYAAPCAAAVQSALSVGANPDEPTGWFEQLRRLRNRVTHRATASRHFKVNVGGSPEREPVEIKVPGLGSQPPDLYLATMRASIRALVQDMLIDAYALAPRELYDLGPAVPLPKSQPTL